MVQLLDRFKKGESEDRALEAVYGFDRDGLEVLWREWIGAEPMEEESEADAEPTATLPPTFAPIGGPTVQPTNTPTEPPPEPTPEPDLSDNESDQAQPLEDGGQLNLVLLFSLLGIVVIAAVVVIILIKRRSASAQLEAGPQDRE